MSISVDLQVVCRVDSIPQETEVRCWLEDAYQAGKPDARGQSDDEQELLGDLVICGPLVEREAEEQGKSAAGHWGHLLVHGMLHLLGYDHETSSQATEMETMEKRILANRGVEDPYQVR